MQRRVCQGVQGHGEDARDSLAVKDRAGAQRTQDAQLASRWPALRATRGWEGLLGERLASSQKGFSYRLASSSGGNRQGRCTAGGAHATQISSLLRLGAYFWKPWPGG